MTNLKSYIRICFAIVFMAGMTSCSGDDFSENSKPAQDSENRYDVSFTFDIEGNPAMTRGVNGYDGANTGIIGTGTMVDHILWALYDDRGNLLERFAKEETSVITLNGKQVKAGKGQNIHLWEGKSLSINISSLNEGAYRIVCWAQSSLCDAYNTSDLSKVKVNYLQAPNNDESRDAFCASQLINVNSDGNRTVILTRPFAQINVGTSGADFKTSANTPGGDYYTYSRVEIKGAADILDVVNEKAEISQEAQNQVVVFDWAPAAGYVSSEIPTGTPSTNSDDNNPFLFGEGEQYLQVDLDGDQVFQPFKTIYDTVKKNSDGSLTYLTETFKYLSMCYVLVPFSSENASTKAAASTVMPEFKVSFSNNSKGEEISAVTTYFKLNNMPARKNWRTNILGGLYEKQGNNGNPDPGPGQDPNPGQDPDPDPSSLFNGVKCYVEVSPTYFNENHIPDINEFQTK